MFNIRQTIYICGMNDRSAPSAPIHFVGGFSLDSMIHADGRVETDRVGGNALWAALGALAVGATGSAHAVLGRDFPATALERVHALGIGVAGIRRNRAHRGVRVTYSYLADGTRRQPADPAAVSALPAPSRESFVDTTQDPEEILASLPAPADLPPSLDGTAWHLGLLPLSRFAELSTHLRESGAAYIQSDCPARSELRTKGAEALRGQLGTLDAFLPSTSDTDEFLPGMPPQEIIAVFRSWGAGLLVLKCGEEGALVADGSGIWHIPVYPETFVVDPTGAGDVFGGVFLAEHLRSGDPVAAACTAAATASLSLRVRDPFAVAAFDDDEIRRRAHRISKNVRRAA